MLPMGFDCSSSLCYFFEGLAALLVEVNFFNLLVECAPGCFDWLSAEAFSSVIAKFQVCLHFLAAGVVLSVYVLLYGLIMLYRLLCSGSEHCFFVWCCDVISRIGDVIFLICLLDT